MKTGCFVRTILAVIALLTLVISAACAADSKIVVPNDFHGTANISFCTGSTTESSISLDSTGQGKSGLCQKVIKKISIQRVNGESIPVQNMQVATTGDGIVVSATFNVP
jgi:hypothetical protein